MNAVLSYPVYFLPVRRPMQRAKKLRFCLCVASWGLFFFLFLPHAAAESFKNPPLVLTGSYPTALNTGDFNGDGIPDLAYTDGSGMHILLGNGDGTFQHGEDIALPAWAGGTITVADVNKDGKTDLLFSGLYFPSGGQNPEPEIVVFLGNGNGTFGSPVVSTLTLNLSLFPLISSLGVADFNGDGAVDLIAPDAQNSQIYVLLGNNTGAFTLENAFHINAYPGKVWTGDFNGDGHQDFLVYGGIASNVTVYLGKGDGTFQTGVVYGGGSSSGFTGVVLADMDGDGHPDMVVGTQTNTIEILHGNADGTFATTSSGGATLNSYPIVLAVADFNSDGVLDIAVEDGSGLGILLGTGSLNYATPVPYGLDTSSYTFTVADFNRDGHLDCALAEPGGIHAVADRVETWTADGTLMPGIDVRLAPGHTPGSSVVVVSDGTARALLLGDIIHCPLELMDDDFNLLVDHDQELANRVREAYARELEGSDVPVAAAHFPGLRFGRLLPGETTRRWTFVGGATSLVPVTLD